VNEIMMDKLVSVIILNYNGGKIILDCLESVFQSKYPNFEVLVIDNNSTDDSQKISKEKFPKIILIIIGKGPYRDNLERLVDQNNLQNNVIFKGHVSEEEKNNLISTSQALVFPSLFEGFGLVILEAFMQKKPILVSDVRPLSDIVSHKETGLVIPAHDEKEWVKAIESIIQEPIKASRMGQEGRIVLEQDYTLHKMEKLILNMYRDVLK